MEPSREQLAELAQQLASTAPEEIDCDAVLERVAAYLEAKESDVALTPELEMVRQHLEICPDCLEEFQALVRTSALN